MKIKDFNVFVLQPIDSRKSFYGKALVIVRNGVAILRSYDTEVASIDIEKKNFTMLWNDRTHTTTRHIKAFKAFYGIKE